MNLRLRRTRLLLSVPLALLLVVAAACGDDDDDTATSDTTGASSATTASGAATTAGADEVDYSDLKGEITISGSSTVEPISTVVLGKFEDLAPDVSVSVEGPGTTAGFEKFCKGETDISDASRQITDAEATTCEGAGIKFVELKIGLDGLSVISSPKNTAVSCLSFLDLYALLGPEADGTKSWADAKPLATDLATALGTKYGPNNSAKYPAGSLAVTAPGPESGTYGSFVEIVTEPIAKERIAAGKLAKERQKTPRNDYTSSGNDNTIIDGISGATDSLGWVGFAFADENSDKVKTMDVDTGKGCVKPTADTVRDGSYPLSRALYIYVNSAKLQSNPALEGFVDFYLSDDGLASVTEADYFDLSSTDIEKTQAAWEAKTLGKQKAS